MAWRGAWEISFSDDDEEPENECSIDHAYPGPNVLLLTLLRLTGREAFIAVEQLIHTLDADQLDDALTYSDDGHPALYVVCARHLNDRARGADPLMTLALFEIILKATFESPRATRYWMVQKRALFGVVVRLVIQSPLALDALPLFVSRLPDTYFGPLPEDPQVLAYPAVYDFGAAFNYMATKGGPDIDSAMERVYFDAFQFVLDRQSRETLVAPDAYRSDTDPAAPRWVVLFLAGMIGYRWREIPQLVRLQERMLFEFIVKVGYRIENPDTGASTDLRALAAQLIRESIDPNSDNKEELVPPFMYEFIAAAPKRA